MNKEDKKDLPRGWDWVQLGNIEFADNQGIIPAKFPDKIYELWSVPNFSIDEPEYVKGKSIGSNKQTVEEGDVLLCKINPRINRVWLVRKKNKYEQIASTEWIVFRTKILNSNYLQFAFQENRFRNEFLKDVSGVGGSLMRARTVGIRKLSIPLPPLPEQQRIADKIEKLFTRSKKIKTNLDQVPKQLERLRKSILAAAVRNDGELETTNSVCEEIQIGPFGTQLHKHDYISNGIPLINPTHIQKGQIIPDLDLTISKTKFEELPNYHMKTNDTIMGRRGEMARCALVSNKENGWLCGTGSLYFRPNLKKINPQYLYWVLSNSNTKAFLEQAANGSTMSNLNLSIARNIPIPLPPLAEQKEIVRRVEKLLSNVDKLEAAYKQYSQKLNTLNQSILAKAFRGELVPQDPNDEPASVLLERIKAGGSIQKT